MKSFLATFVVYMFMLVILYLAAYSAFVRAQPGGEWEDWVVEGDNLGDCVFNAPTSAHECKPGQAPEGARKFEIRADYGTQDNPIQRCEVQAIWMDGRLCNFCKVDEPCGT